MIRHYLNIALRSFLKNKIFSLINVGGLSIGLAAFLLIMYYVHYERNYESFLREPESVYRVQLDQYQNDALSISSAENYPGVGPAMLESFPEVEAYARLYNMGYKNNLIITWEEAPNGPQSYKHRNFLYADSAFLPMMGYKMLQGDAVTALAAPYQTVISERYAKMYFGNENPLGKNLRLQDDDRNNELATVTGVFADLPANSHLQFDVLYSYGTLIARGDWAPGRYHKSWSRKDMYTYVRLRRGSDPRLLESRFPEMIAQYNPGLEEQGRKDVLSLQPLESIHLHSNLAEEQQVNGNAGNVATLFWVACFVLLIAWVNYINLATAKAMERAREVGVRKTMGAWRIQLIRQFLMESAMTNLLALLLAFVWMQVALPVFNQVSGYDLGIQDLLSPWLIGLGLLVWLGGSLLAGFYPAFVMSSFNPVDTLKGKLINSTKGVLLRKGLVVFQFIASVSLIAGTLIVQNQLDYLMSRDIGMDIDQVLVIERPGVLPKETGERNEAYRAGIDLFRRKAEELPAVKGVTIMVTVPGKKREYKVPVKPYGTADDQLVTVRLNSMDFQTPEVLGMEVLAGRSFSKDFVNDPDTAVVLTESAARLLGYSPEEAIGQTMEVPAWRWNPIIVGVVNDYHQESLRKAKDPIFFICSDYGGEFFALKVGQATMSNTIREVEAAWNAAFPGNPMDYFFLDEYFNRQYVNDLHFAGLISSFSGLAILLGCLGLFGLSAYLARQKTKEIGIRKVLGSSVLGIFVLLSQEFLVLIGLAVLLAVPNTYILMNSWLEGFAYRHEISWMTFVLAALLVLLIAALTISYHTLRAARVNPVRALRYE